MLRELRYIYIHITDSDLSSMEIAPQSLTTCEVAPGGSTIVLGFANSDGTPAQIRLSLKQVGELAMTLPDLITKALRLRYGDHTLRYAYPLASWAVERSSDHATGMVTVCTTDGFSVCFSMPRELQHKLANSLASDGPYKTQITMN
jgi:hypothetical protein